MKNFLVFLITMLGCQQLAAKEYVLTSPDQQIEVKVEVGAQTTYAVNYKGKAILAPSILSMSFQDGTIIGEKMKVSHVYYDKIKKELRPVVRQKCASINDEYNEMVLKAKKYQIVFRVYNDGVAYRFKTDFSKPVIVNSEVVTYKFAHDVVTIFPEEKSFLTPQQPYFKEQKLSEIKTDKFCSTPLLIKVDDKVRVLISESDLESYPGMFLKKQSRYELCGKFAPYVLEEDTLPARVCFPTKRANYLAKTKGQRSYPWRAMIVTDNDANLITNQLIYKLAPAPTTKDDFSWVRPGKISWDWWNALALYNVDFKAGINTATYKYYIDFAAKYNLEYVVIDDGWSEPRDVTKTIPEIDMEELTSYAAKKDVGLILWVSWVPFNRNMDNAFELFHKWGIKGLKIDFMNRDDQKVVDFYYRTARKAVKYKMLVDFHGAYKPTGWSRTFPNVMTSEGVSGLENCKWSDSATPKHNVTLPFNRMVAGPMDYTPGGMNNLHLKDFKILFNTPFTIGTRCHQLGMYVVYESPLQMLADSPSNYYREKKCMEFLSAVPSVWDETKVLKASIGEYIVVARRSGDTWYIGGMTGDKAQTFKISLDFIKGTQTLTSWEDGINVALQARDFSEKTKTVKKGDTILIKMYKGGGYAAIIK